MTAARRAYRATASQSSLGPSSDGVGAPGGAIRATTTIASAARCANAVASEYVFDALRAGASGFLVKDTEPAEIVQALRVVADGDALLSPAITRRLISEFVARPPEVVSVSTLEALTAREREVVALVGYGLSNDEIAERLVVSPTTAKTHVSRAMTKTGVRDRAQLVVFAYETGLVQPRERES
ncbi:response regulator transcription factor [Mumia sp. zg.B21]|nr:response regulator transcription factor [Mumia sp. zg.B21]